MKIDSDWKGILKKAWSIRLMVLAGVLSGCEVILPLYADAIPRGPFAALSMLAIASAFVARIIAQRDLPK